MFYMYLIIVHMLGEVFTTDTGLLIGPRTGPLTLARGRTFGSVDWPIHDSLEFLYAPGSVCRPIQDLTDRSDWPIQWLTDRSADRSVVCCSRSNYRDSFCSRLDRSAERSSCEQRVRTAETSSLIGLPTDPRPPDRSADRSGVSDFVSETLISALMRAKIIIQHYKS